MKKVVAGDFEDFKGEVYEYIQDDPGLTINSLIKINKLRGAPDVEGKIL